MDSSFNRHAGVKILLFSMLLSFAPTVSHAACVMPNGAPNAGAGDIAYINDDDVMQYCNGSDWISMGGGGGAGGLPTCADNEVPQYDDGTDTWGCTALPAATAPSG